MHSACAHDARTPADPQSAQVSNEHLPPDAAYFFRPAAPPLAPFAAFIASSSEISLPSASTQ
jgi:hypothetical protein